MNWVHSGKTTRGDGMFKPGLLCFIRVDTNRHSLGQVWGIKERFQLSEAFLRWAIELVFADLFHGSLGMGNTEHRLGRVGMVFHRHQSHFVFSFQYLGFGISPSSGSQQHFQSVVLYDTYIHLVLIHSLGYVLSFLLGHSLLEVMVLRLLTWGILYLRAFYLYSSLHPRS